MAQQNAIANELLEKYNSNRTTVMFLPEEAFRGNEATWLETKDCNSLEDAVNAVALDNDAHHSYVVTVHSNEADIQISQTELSALIYHIKNSEK